jgi:hypothetical protein
VKAVSEQGVRLNIRKATLHEWRKEFARHLRGQGIEANATERAVRGQVKGHKLDGIYRAMKDGKRHSTRMSESGRHALILRLRAPPSAAGRCRPHLHLKAWTPS